MSEIMSTHMIRMKALAESMKDIYDQVEENRIKMLALNDENKALQEIAREINAELVKEMMKEIEANKEKKNTPKDTTL